MRYAFGEFELDPSAYVLTCRGTTLALQPKVFELISLLVENRHRVVAKEELLAALWPDVHVSESALAWCVSQARRVLDESGGESSIKTAHRRGYRFDAQVTIRGELKTLRPSTQRQFFGRDETMAALRGTLELARRGCGGGHLLMGDAGIGKTRCAEELAAEARTAKINAWVDRCLEDEGAPVLWPWVQILRACLEDTCDHVVRERCSKLLADLVPEHEDQTDSTFANGRQKSFWLLDRLVTFLTERATERPCIIVIDDVQWSDEHSLRVLDLLMREAKRHAILLLVTFRDGDDGARAPTFDAPDAAAPSGHTRLEPFLYEDPKTDRTFFATSKLVLDGLTNFKDVPGIDLSVGEKPGSWNYASVAPRSRDWVKIFAGPAVTSKTVGYSDVVYLTAPSPIAGNWAGLFPPPDFQYVYKSLDGGQTWNQAGTLVIDPSKVADCTTSDYIMFGDGAVGAGGTIYLGERLCTHLAIAVSYDEGATWTAHEVPGATLPPYPSGGSPLAILSRLNAITGEPIALDPAGNLYAVWADPQDHLFFSTSKDGGVNWTAPVWAMAPGVTSIRYAAVAAKSAGTAAIAYFGSKDGTVFDGYIAESTNALDASPTFWSASVSPPSEPLYPNGFISGYDLTHFSNGGDNVEFVQVKYAPSGDIWASFAKNMCPNGTDTCNWDYAAHANSRFQGAAGRLVHVAGPAPAPDGGGALDAGTAAVVPLDAGANYKCLSNLPTIDPGGNKSSGASCCGGLGTCQLATSAGAIAGSLGHDSCRKSAGSDDLLCAPTTGTLTAAGALAKCQALLGATVDIEGRCVPACFVEGNPYVDELSPDGCGAGELCAPCFNPVDASATGICSLEAGDAPTTSAPPPWKTCESTDGGVPQGICVPTDMIVASKNPDATLLEQHDCDTGQECVPTLKAENLNSCFSRCTSSSLSASGACVPTFVVRDLSPLYVSFLANDGCGAGNLCAPCIDPTTQSPSHACD